MITVQGYKESKDSIMIVFDTQGIDEFIQYLSHIRDIDSSMHLNINNELEGAADIDDDMYVIPHVKIVNLDRID